MCSAASVVSDSLQLYGPYPPRLHCPWDSPGKNTGVGCHALLQGIFLTQGWNPHLDVSCIGSLPLASLPTESLNSPRYNHYVRTLQLHTPLCSPDPITTIKVCLAFEIALLQSSDQVRCVLTSLRSTSSTSAAEIYA